MPDSGVETDDAVQILVMAYRHIQYAFVSLAKEFDLDSLGGPWEAADIVHHHRLPFHHVPVQPGHQRCRNILKLPHKWLCLASTPFMSIPEAQHVRMIFKHPRSVGANLLAHES